MKTEDLALLRMKIEQVEGEVTLYRVLVVLLVAVILAELFVIARIMWGLV